jgi:hypothetical protein
VILVNFRKVERKTGNGSPGREFPKHMEPKKGGMGEIRLSMILSTNPREIFRGIRQVSSNMEALKFIASYYPNEDGALAALNEIWNKAGSLEPWSEEAESVKDALVLVATNSVILEARKVACEHLKTMQRVNGDIGTMVFIRAAQPPDESRRLSPATFRSELGEILESEDLEPTG